MQRDYLGKYQLLELIGAGAQSTVHKALDLQSSTVYAIKQLLPGYAASRDDLLRFHREADLLATIDHRNVIKIFDSCANEDHGPEAPHYIVLEYIPDSSRDLLKEHPDGLPLTRAIHIISQAASGLQATWDGGVLHRDIKPSNILVGPEDSAKLSDFGVGRDITSRTVTSTGALLGSLHYMAPELFEGGIDPDIRSDIYALGVTFFEILTGRLPFEGSEAHLVRSHLGIVPPSVSEIRQDLPVSLDAVIRRCLEKNPDRRFREPDELITALKDLPMHPDDPSQTLFRRSIRQNVEEQAQPASIPGVDRNRWLYYTHIALFFLVIFSVIALQFLGMSEVKAYQPLWATLAVFWLVGITAHTYFIARNRRIMSVGVAAIGLLVYVISINPFIEWEILSSTNGLERPVDSLPLPTSTDVELVFMDFTNGSVEEGSGSFPTGWEEFRRLPISDTELLWTSDVARTGSKSLMMSDIPTSNPFHPLAAWATSGLIEVDLSKVYEFSVWYYTPDRSAPVLYVNAYNAQRVHIGSGGTGFTSRIPEAGKWHKASYRLMTAALSTSLGEPITSVRLEIRYVVNDPRKTSLGSPATIYYDDASFVVIDPSATPP